MGLLAALFTALSKFGMITNDPSGKPAIRFFLNDLDGRKEQGERAEDKGPSRFIPSWPYAVHNTGLVIKVLRAGSGEALLVVADGYSLLLGAGSGAWQVGAQLSLCGVRRLQAAVALSTEEAYLGGMPYVARAHAPSYLFYPPMQTNSLALEKTKPLLAEGAMYPAALGMSFNLGRAVVTFIGPAHTGHVDPRDDGLSLSIDYETTTALVLGNITSGAEQELLEAGLLPKADVLICANGGDETATSAGCIAAVRPKIAVCTGNADWKVKARLEQVGADVYTTQENGVITLYTAGDQWKVFP